ncbi:glycosyltransferase family 9 protein [Amnibacterium sp. CER49]|uniref:glycosyltransferase family 9 protein n=1 Tax=Amnibacterium sp. CER49 TaxID=3039161 RepID=UPI002448ECFE|nr:glycosyltransferase family 9 protein [Amnibacterium sp. CER49]MDH2443436.1 glycosyltransferase family 9 protein [Amnibacterium sp. CER49]
MTPRTIVVVDTMGGLGDLVLSLPVLEGLARSHPAARLTVVTTAPWHELLLRDPRIAEVVPVPGKDEATIVGVATGVLERIRPDLAITTNRQFGLPVLLQRTARRAVTDLWRRPPADELVDLRYLRLLVADGVVAARFADLPPRLVLGPDELDEAAELLGRLAAGPPVLLFPDSGMPVKRWPVPSWRALVGELRRRGATPVVVAEDAALRDVLVEAGAVPSPSLPLRALAALCAAAAPRHGAAVGGDTGPVRVATAAGLPAVGLYGATLALRYGLREGLGTNVQGWAACPERRPTAITEQACWWTGTCPFTRDGTPRCMAEIRPEQVLAALRP